MASRKHAKFRSAFGAALEKQLETKHVTQSALAQSVGASATYVNHVMAGRKMPLYDLVASIVTELKLTDAEELMLHRAAARTHKKPT